MTKIGKIIIIILFLLLGGSVFMVLSTLSQKTALENEKTTLQGELTQAGEREQELVARVKDTESKIEEAKQNNERLQQQLSDLNGQISSLENTINSLRSERDNWRNRVNDLRRERDELITKLQEKPKVIYKEREPEPEEEQPGKPPVMATGATEDQERYWARVLKDKAALELKINELQSQLSQYEVSLEELKKVNSDLDLELSQLRNQKEEIQRQIKYSEDLANTLSIELAREKNDKRFIDQRLDKIKEENLDLRSKVKELTSTKIALEKSIARLRESKDKVERKLAETESVIQNRIDEVLDIKETLDRKLSEPIEEEGTQSVELPPIVVSAPKAGGPAVAQESRMAPGFEGHVLSVNEENNFVITDLGLNSGVRIGDNLSIYRNGKYIAGLEIIQVRKDISAADIKQKGARIQVGDNVR